MSNALVESKLRNRIRLLEDNLKFYGKQILSRNQLYRKQLNRHYNQAVQEFEKQFGPLEELDAKD